MSMSDARQFAELSERVGRLEARLQEIFDRVEGKDVSDEVLGPVADEAARDGLRAMLKERRTGIAPEADMPSSIPVERKLPSGGPPVAEGSDPASEANELALATDPGLKDRLAALQGGEAQSVSSKPGMRK